MNLTKLIKYSKIRRTKNATLPEKKIDTRQTRKEIGFPEYKHDWTKTPAVFDEHTLRIAGHPVMEDWEQGYMETLAEITSRNGGRVLELGYGMGLSAKAIQSHHITKHYIIEAHPDVVIRGLTDLRGPIESNKVHFLSGLWEDVTPLLAANSFDGILFDTYPLSEEEIHSNHFWFFKEAYRLLKPNGILTYYSDEVDGYSDQHIAKLLEAGFNPDKLSSIVCKVKPPEDCEYWQHDTILAPIVVK